MNPNEAYACVLSNNKAYERVNKISLATNQESNFDQKISNSSVPLYEEVA